MIAEHDLDPGFTFDPSIARELADRWLLVELLLTRLNGSRERDVVLMAVNDTKAAELRLLESVRPCPGAEPRHERTPDDGPAGRRRGPEAPPSPRARHSYTDQEKDDAVRLADGAGRAEASRRLGVHATTLARWKREGHPRAEAAPPPPEAPARPAPEPPRPKWGPSTPIGRQPFDPDQARAAAVDAAIPLGST